jgi:hypothetical protein
MFHLNINKLRLPDQTSSKCGDESSIFPWKGRVKLGPMPVIGFNGKIIAKTVLKR